MTARQEILAAARNLSDRGISPFSPKQLITEVERNGTRYSEEKLRSHIVSAMCVDAPQHNPSYRELRRVGHGLYVLLDDAGGPIPRGARRGSGRAGQVGERPATIAELSGRPWSWEGNVQQVFVEHLARDGWEIVNAADTASREFVCECC